MSFIDNYRHFVDDQGKLKGHKYQNEMVETIKFLLKNAIGQKNGVSTNKIILHLRSKGYKISRETWQIEVLGTLRDNGVYIGSLRGNIGMFLIASKNDAVSTRNAIYERLVVEQKRMDKLEKLMKKEGWDFS